MEFAAPRGLTRLAALLAASAALAAAQTPARVGPVSQRKASMTPTPVDSSSPSAILRATHILLIRIESARPTPWAEGQRGPHRTVDLSLRLEEILKGRVREAQGSIVSTKVEQTGLAGTRIYALPGVWSGHPVDAGTRLVAFCTGSGDRAPDLLVEPLLESLLPADEALDDVRLAMRAERTTRLADILDLAKPAAAQLHYPFAEYLSAKAEGTLLMDREVFARLAQFVEDPSLSLIVRSTLVKNINAALLARDPVPTPFVSTWVATLFHVMGMPAASGIHDNILQVFLPNVVGISGGAAKRKASDLFRDAPAERERAERILAAYRGPAAQAVSQWLRE
jgi:hypothetical protein